MINQTNGERLTLLDSFLLKTFVMLHSVVHMEIDRKCCVKKKELERGVQTQTLLHPNSIGEGILDAVRQYDKHFF